MKNLFKRAHEMTKEMKEKYPEVDYRTQFGLCISFLLGEGKGEEEMKELQGTEKQIKWAEDILVREEIWHEDIKTLVEETKRRLGERGGEKAEGYLKQLDTYIDAIEITHNYIRSEDRASKIIDLGIDMNDENAPYRIMDSLIWHLATIGALENEELLKKLNIVVGNMSRPLWTEISNERHREGK